ncbi:MAG TPA: UDP-N-acetylglucosamine diphosphorylase, partial [bacterium]|nr:UDP-N-acetylglucosamine diphosphorylase [bacterium]
MTTKITDLFDLDGFRFKDVFSEIEAPWNALSSIGSYIASAGTARILGKVSPGAWLEGDMISIGAGSVVEPGAMIIGPALIGENCAI